MTIKEIINLFGLPAEYQPIVNSIDYEKLEDFVSMMANSILAKYGKTYLKKEIDNDTTNSQINDLLTHIIEIGGLKILADNKLQNEFVHNPQKVTTVICLAMNFSLSKELKRIGVFDMVAYNYYDLNVVQIIANRLIDHIKYGHPELTEEFNKYAREMVKTHLFNNL